MIWSPQNRYLIGFAFRGLYLIDIQNASRQKRVVDFSVTNPLWSLDETKVLLNDERKNLYQFNITSLEITPFNRELDLKNTVWIDSDTLVFYEYSVDENRLQIHQLQLNSGEETEILNRFNFPVSQIASDAEKRVHFFNPSDQTWYQLDY